jgi:hypothetical protein
MSIAMLEVEDAGAAKTRLRDRRQEAMASGNSMVSFIKEKEQDPPSFMQLCTVSYIISGGECMYL